MFHDDFKCVLIKPDKTAKTKTIKNVKHLFKNMEHVALDGLDYLDTRYRLGLWCRPNGKEFNSVATSILRHMKTRFNVLPDDEKYKLYGNVILYDDEKNLSNETWERIRKEIKCKKKRQPPQPEVDNYIKFAEDRIADMADNEHWLYKKFESAIQDAKAYGKIGF